MKNRPGNRHSFNQEKFTPAQKTIRKKWLQSYFGVMTFALITKAVKAGSMVLRNQMSPKWVLIIYIFTTCCILASLYLTYFLAYKKHGTKWLPFFTFSQRLYFSLNFCNFSSRSAFSFPSSFARSSSCSCHFLSSYSFIA